MKKAGNFSNSSLESMLDKIGLPRATVDEIYTLVDIGQNMGWIDFNHYHSIKESLQKYDNLKAFTLAVTCLYNKLLEKDRRIDDLSRDAYTDSLTGLNNRRGMDEIIEERKASDNYAVIYFDVDHFKRFNDTYGHHVGDLVLKYVGQTVRECVRGDDAGRWGGEEFVVVLKNSDVSGASIVAERLRHEIENYASKKVIAHLEDCKDYEMARRLDDETITASFGVSSKSEGKTPLDVVNLADERMYHAKHNMGRNAVCSGT